MNHEPTQQQNIARLVERLSNEMNAAPPEMSVSGVTTAHFAGDRLAA